MRNDEGRPEERPADATASLARVLDMVYPQGRYKGLRVAEIFAVAPDPWRFFGWVAKNNTGPSGDAAAVLLEHLPLERAA